MEFHFNNSRIQSKYSLLTFFYAITMSCLVVFSVQAASSDESVTEEAAKPEFKSFPDRSHKYIAGILDTWATRIDGYFGSSRYDLEEANTILRIRSVYVWDEHRSNQSKLQIRGKIRLPKIKERFNIIFTGDNNEELADTREIDNVDLKQENQRGVDLQIGDDERKHRSLHYRVGIRSGFKLRFSAAYRKDYYFKSFLMRFSEEPYWQDKRGFGLRTRLDTDYMLSEKRQISWLNRIEFGEDSAGLDWSTFISYRRVINNKDAISYYGGASGGTRASYLTRNYKLGMLYRKNIARKWLFLEVEPSYQWRRDNVFDKRKGATIVTARFEVNFSE